MTIPYLALALSVIALFWLWRTGKKNAQLKEEIAKVNSKLYHTKRELLETQNSFKQDLTRLNYELLKAQGNLQITPEITIDELAMIHPQAEQILAGFHIGGCSSCSVDGNERLDLAAARSGQPIEPILLALNNLVTAGETSPDGMVSEEMLKTPNVALTL